MEANAEQLQAINSNSERILCLAGAGAGKSTTLLSRISRLVNDGVNPNSILALTFTNAAGAEMRERYERSHVGQLAPQFRTFHSFCYYIVCRDPAIRSGLGYDTIPNIASDAEEKEIIEKAKAQCKISVPATKLLSREGLTKKEKFQVELFDKAICRLLRQNNLITFDKLNSEVADLFAADHISTKPYKQQYKYIAVDEFQDVDTYQMKFLQSFTDTNFFFVGDTLQNIYTFRGTSNEYIKALSNSPDWEKIKLFTNYRSTKQICEYANKFSASYADDSYRIEMKSERDGEKVITTSVASPSNYNVINTDGLDEVINELSKLSGTSAILARTNKEVSEINSYLKEKGIEFSTNHNTQIFNIINAAISEEYMIGWLASFLSSNKYGEYIRLCAQRKPDINWFLKTYGTNTKISKVASKISNLKKIATDPTSTAIKIEEIRKAFKLSDITPPDTELFGAELLQYIKDRLNDIKSSELYVGTIHSVKGLEYDNVFVMNVNSYSFKIKGDEEMSNLFYVACTRAKNRLFIYKINNW